MRSHPFCVKISDDILEKMDSIGCKKSDIINEALRDKFLCIDGLKELREDYEKRIKEIDKQISKLEAKKKKEEDKNKMEKPLRDKLKEVKESVDSDPSRIELWRKVVNDSFGTIYSPSNFKKVLENV